MDRPPARLRIALARLFVAAALAGAVHAQGGYTTEKHPALGMNFSRARDYEAVPVRPSEEWIVLYYAEKEAFRERDRKRYRPELRFVWIDHDPPVAETGPVGPPQPRDAAVASDGSDGTEEPPPPPIDSFERYVEQELSLWKLGPAVRLDDRHDNEVWEHELTFRKKHPPFAGWACTFRDGERTVGVFGFCAEEDLREQEKIWRTMLKKIKFYEPETASLAKIERLYSRKKYSLTDYRIRVRSRLVKGWEAEDTENFILVYSTKDKPLLRAIKSELEAIREEYVRLFPPVREIEAVSTVRVCKDEAEYQKYGGPVGSGGYWSAANEELVFYDYENVGGKKGTGKANSRIVLYHEAFHQYVYYAVGRLAPHSWFNEGTGDYFSGALIRGGKVKKIGVNPWRIRLIQGALERGFPKTVPFAKILAFTQDEFYKPKRRAICYAQAWSMVYFLRKSKVVAKHPVWSGILERYFETLKSEYDERVAAEAVPVEAMDEETLEGVQQGARDAALAAAFAEVDLRALEEEWKEFTLDLKPPR